MYRLTNRRHSYSTLVLLIALVLVTISGMARAQDDGLGLPQAPPASAIGPAVPLALASQVAPMAAGAAASLASYLGASVQSSLPQQVLRGSPEGDGARALGDASGPIALYVPARGVTREALHAPPADGLPVGWLFLRYATLYSGGDEVPEDRLASVVIPGPWRMTLLPLNVTSEQGQLRLNVLASDGAVIASQPLHGAESTSGDNGVALRLGPPPIGPAPRDLTLQAPGYTAGFKIGATPEAERMPRPLVGDLKVGEMAPDFELKLAKSDGLVRLSDSRGRQPIVLIFGSYT
ncbi:MAG TPA: hypothetical protein VFJ58_24565 [Armatimonadota bacterium]|nr:hypothetical protein [Armatimonadota bacterium]